jgi:ABC-type transport system substrate-binding protein
MKKHVWFALVLMVVLTALVLTSVGCGGPGKVKLVFNSGAGHDEVMQLVKSDLAVIGIETEFETSDGPTYWSKVEADQFQIGRSGWQADYPSMYDFLYPLFYSTSDLNYDNYNKPEVDKAISAAAAIVDEGQRIAAYQAIVKTIGEDVPEAVIAPYAHNYVTSTRVHNLVYSAMGLFNYPAIWLGEGADTAVSGGTLAVYISDPSFIDPSQAFESEGIKVDSALFEPLLQYDPKTLQLVPGVAESWEGSTDATVWTFHLKQGTLFHNGREVKAADFKYAWERLSTQELASGYGSLLSMIKGYQDFWDTKATEITGINVVDDYTLEVTMAEPFADFPYVAAFNSTAPIPKEEVEKGEDAWAENPIGNGPFMMSEPWKAGEYVKVVRFPDYKGTKPYLDGIDFKIYADLNTAWVDFQAGTIDWTQIPSGQYKSTVTKYGLSTDGYTANPGKQVQNGAELGSYEVLFNNTDPLLSNIHMRRAISLAINRQAICDTVWEGVRSPGSSIIPPGIPGFEAGAWPYNHYDVQAALAELRQVPGYENATLKETK